MVAPDSCRIPDNAGTLLLQTCGTCLYEIAKLRHDVQQIAHSLANHDPPILDKKLGLTESSDLAIADEALGSSCAIKDDTLREFLLSEMQDGKIGVELRGLAGANRWATKADAEADEGNQEEIQGNRLGDMLATEYSDGNIHAVVLRNGLLITETSQVQEIIKAEAEMATKGADDSNPEGQEERSSVIVFPKFSKLSWPLMEVLLQWCRRERLTPPLDLLCEMVKNLLQGDKANVDVMALLRLIGEGMGRSMATVGMHSDGRFFTTSSKGPGVEDNIATKGPLPLFHQAGRGFGESMDDEDDQELKRALRCLSEQFAAVQATCGAVQEGEKLRAPGVLLGLMSILRGDRVEKEKETETESEAKEVEAPVSCGAALWAYEHLLARGGPEKPKPKPEVSQNQSQNESQSQEQQAQEVYEEEEEDAQSGGDRESEDSETGSQASGEKSGMVSDEKNRAGATTDDAQPSSEAGPGDSWEKSSPRGGASPTTNAELKRGDVQAAFLACFKDDLLQARHLFMSQLNNLFKMRNGGDSLRYKEVGFEKLHELVLAIPGLQLHGSGNQMEIRVFDRSGLEEFCDKMLEGRAVPRCEKQIPVPESFQKQVVEVFRRAGSREIPAKDFRNLWNSFFPAERLQCKDFGFRDMRGLLANIPVINKVGGKYNARYVLRNDISLAPNGGNSSVSVPGSSGQDASFIGGQPLKIPMSKSPPQNIVEGLTPSSSHELAPQGPGWGLSMPACLSSQRQMPPGTWGPSQQAMGVRSLEGATPTSSAATEEATNSRTLGSSVGIRGIRSMPQQERWETRSSELNSLQQWRTWPRGGRPEGTISDEVHGLGSRGLGDVRFDVDHRDDFEAHLAVDPSVVPTGEDSQRVMPPGLGAGLGALRGPDRIPVAPGTTPGTVWPVEEMGADRSRYFAMRMREEPGSQMAASASGAGLLMPVQLTTGQQAGDSALAPETEVARRDSNAGIDSQGVSSRTPSMLGMPQNIIIHRTNALEAEEEDEAEKLWRERRNQRTKNRGKGYFASSPGAFSSESRDASRHQGKFDMHTLYQARLRSDRHCVVVDFATSRVLFSSALCDSLFEQMIPLLQRDVTELIYEDDRLTFSASIIYLNLGNFSVMEPQEMRILSAGGVVPAKLFGEQLVGSWWWLDFAPCTPEDESVGGLSGSSAAGASGASPGRSWHPLGGSAAPSVGPWHTLGSTMSGFGAGGSCVSENAATAGPSSPHGQDAWNAERVCL
mmetsp:Transcript_29633/g.64469  ORF Transcript_29633/g.64469 Transcript_29633/m.64469 type:complete len:1233 (-) Transcript_29633:68-3766(-)